MVIAGEAGEWISALGQFVGPQFLQTRFASNDRELLEIVESGEPDVAVLDDEASWDVDLMRLLRTIRRMDNDLAVILVTRHRERRWLEDALQLSAFSVIAKPLELEMFLRQIYGVMVRLNRIV